MKILPQFPFFCAVFLNFSSLLAQGFSDSQTPYSHLASSSSSSDLAPKMQMHPEELEEIAEIINNLIKSTVESSDKSTLYKNKKMNVSPHSDDLVSSFTADEFPEEKEIIHDNMDGKTAIHQALSSNSKLSSSSEVMTMQEGINKVGLRPIKQVAFDLSPERGMTSSSIGKRFEKRPLLTSRKLKELTSGIEIAIDDIPEGAPDRAACVAAIYAVAYPKIKMQFQGLLSTIKNDVELQNEKEAIILANTAIELMNASFNSVNLEDANPIKIENNTSDHVVVEKTIPFTITPYSDIEPSDFEAVTIVLAGDSVIKDLQEFTTVFKSSDADAGQALYNSLAYSSGRACVVAYRKLSVMYKKINILRNSVGESSTEFIQAMLEKNRAYDYYRECSHISMLRYQSMPIADPVEVRKKAIANILIMAENTLEIADQIRAMLVFRSKNTNA
ncbi:MAG: hypothetical protein A3F67_04165 [Verrucomicrobia bacterium RIFCSPHIGHO2_12_FULL_41_10]|nr:MAG: hypothetical protein A3F67_04165 [Verrucomicrobia bacterium RIFCSPHIGHO2_12_FULL_41_10]HLB33719.1 hypothetical protein [Chthoniobacterales bacterium]